MRQRKGVEALSYLAGFLRSRSRGREGSLNLVQSLARMVRIALTQCFCSLAEFCSASETVWYHHGARAFPAGLATAQRGGQKTPRRTLHLLNFIRLVKGHGERGGSSGEQEYHRGEAALQRH